MAPRLPIGPTMKPLALLAALATAVTGCITNNNAPEAPEPGIATMELVSSQCVAGAIAEVEFTLDVTLEEGQAFSGLAYWQNPQLVQGRFSYDCGGWTEIERSNPDVIGSLWDGCVREAGQPERQTIRLRNQTWLENGGHAPSVYYASMQGGVYASRDGGLAALFLEGDVNCSPSP